MNALAIDCAVSKIAIAAKKDGKMVKTVLDIGIRQSEKLLPAVDYVMREMELTPQDLTCTVTTLGPGTFTGLRLGLCTLKALTLSHNIPLYGIPSLDAYHWGIRNAGGIHLSVIESKEEEYFYSVFEGGKKIHEDDDKHIDEILSMFTEEDSILVSGPGAASLVEHTKERKPLLKLCAITPWTDSCESLFEMAEEKIKSGEKPLEDYDGPLYIRKSEAEIVYEEKMQGKK